MLCISNLASVDDREQDIIATIARIMNNIVFITPPKSMPKGRITNIRKCQDGNV